MTIENFLLIILFILLIGAIPVWPYSRSWGYAPTGIFTFALAVLIVWFVIGDRPLFGSSGGNIESSVDEAGQNIKSAGRDVADSIRDAVN